MKIFIVLLALATATTLPVKAATSYEAIDCGGGVKGIRVSITDQDFFSAYTSVFQMSDGSRINMPPPPSSNAVPVNSSSPMFRNSLAYIHGLMRMVGIELEEESVIESGDENKDMTFRVCGENVGKIFLLSIIGNFVMFPSDPRSVMSLSFGVGLTSFLDFFEGEFDRVSTQSTTSDAIPSVVIDVYTGKLEMVSSLNVMRSYFLETMLIISILAIAR